MVRNCDRVAMTRATITLKTGAFVMATAAARPHNRRFRRLDRANVPFEAWAGAQSPELSVSSSQPFVAAPPRPQKQADSRQVWCQASSLQKPAQPCEMSRWSLFLHARGFDAQGFVLADRKVTRRGTGPSSDTPGESRRSCKCVQAASTYCRLVWTVD